MTQVFRRSGLRYADYRGEVVPMLPLWESPPGPIRSGSHIWPSRCQAVTSPDQALC